MSSGKPFLPYARQAIEEDDVAAVVAALRSDWLTGGPAVAAFETELSRRCDGAATIACANGTAALHMAALALGLGPGDRVIVPAITFLATANAARYVGADVVFADVDPTTGLMAAGHLAEALDRAGPRARAVFPVHIAGQPCDMAAIGALARSRGLKVVEDAAHALGTRHHGVVTGACEHSDMTTFSFHPVKTVAMGEGGAVATRDAGLAERLRDLRAHGMTRDPARFEHADLAGDGEGGINPWYYEMTDLGFNFRVTDIQCALGLSQLAKLDRFLARRRELVAHYDRLLAPLAPLVRPTARVAGAIPGWHLYVARIDFAAAGLSRAQVMRRLAGLGIGTQVHYIPVPAQPYYRKFGSGPVPPGAQAYYQTCLSLPLFATMTEHDVARVVESLVHVLERKGAQ